MEKRLGLVDATELTSDPDAEPASDPDATGATKPASDPDAADIANADINIKTPSQVAETVYTQSDISQDGLATPHIFHQTTSAQSTFLYCYSLMRPALNLSQCYTTLTERTRNRSPRYG